MNKETFMEYLKKNKYYIYNNWFDYQDEIRDKIDLLITYHQKEIETAKAKLEAQCYAYEKIIANSNFKVIIDKEDLRRRKNENN